MTLRGRRSPTNGAHAFHEPCDPGCKGGIYDAPHQTSEIIPGVAFAELEKSICPASSEMLVRAEREEISTAWDRYQAQLPQCGFGELGTCCRNCLQGPCRIDPFGEGPQEGVCGATADTIVARNLGRAIAAGTAAHSGHAKHLAHTLLKASQGKAPDYPIKDEEKLKAVATRIGIGTEGVEIEEIASAVAETALAEFSEKESPSVWAATTVTQGMVEGAGDNLDS